MSHYDTILKFLGYLNLDIDESKVYLALVEKGELTVLQISREKKISRTNVYRIVDRLVERGLITEIKKDTKRLYNAVGIDQLEVLVKEEESRVEYLKEMLPQLQSILPNEQSIDQPGTHVKFYKGVNGIKQMVWNILESNGEVVGYTFRNLAEVVSRDFALKWMQEFSFRGLVFRDIITENYLGSVKNDTLASQVPTFKNETRFLPRTTLSITNQVDIYNNTVAYYHWHEGEILGVEVIDEKIAKFQKQLFEIVWRTAQRM